MDQIHLVSSSLQLSMPTDINWTLLNEKLPTEKSPDDQSEQRRTIFDTYFDINGNGYSSLAECDKGIKELLPNYSDFFTSQVILRAFSAAKGINTAASNNDDYIEFTEFRMFLSYLKKYAELWQLFDQIDVEGDRRINLDEFTKAIPKLMEYGVPAVDGTFQSIDTNGGGQILFVEFADWAIKQKLNGGN
jgi:hypothetical protein